MILALFSKAFATSSSAHDKFKRILNSMHSRIDATNFDENFICGHDVTIFYEWVNVHVAKHVTGDKSTLLKRFRRSTLTRKPKTDG